MLSKILRYQFSSGGFNILGSISRLKSQLTAPIKHIKRNLEPTGQDYSRMTNTTEEGFDEVSQEWQTLVTHNAFDLQVFNYLENVQTSNFGTVDNPLVVFTADTPFRYVGCTGQQNEDDYEGHELQFFMLREGPLQRCPSCGQVFKLVRLRNEYSPEMDYYMTNFHTYEMREMGESDTTILMSATKFNTHFEHSQFETPSNMVYSMINPDEHDRMLVDPAFRMERTKQLEEKLKVYIFSLQEVEREYFATKGKMAKIPINKQDYATMIDVETQIKRLDRVFKKVQRFEARKFVDRDNHERREARMLQKKAERSDGKYTLFVGGLSEEELMYRDYYETELENYPENEGYEQYLDKVLLLTSDEYSLDRYDFQERHTINPEEDQTSLVEKKLFKFKYRLAGDSIKDYTRRNERMVKKQAERFEKNQMNQVLDTLVKAQEEGTRDEITKAEKAYIDLVTNETVQCYKDYYESDKDQDFSVFDHLPLDQKVQVAKSFENHTLGHASSDGYMLLPKYKHDPSLGVWTNFYNEFNYIRNEILPQAKKASNQAILALGTDLKELAEGDEKKIEQKK